MEPTKSSSRVIVVLCIVAAIAAIAAYVVWRAQAPRSDGLQKALIAESASPAADRAMVARALESAFDETRTNATHWSGAFWGFSFAAATLGALAGLVLKLESLSWTDKVKKDVAASMAVLSALLVTISTSGDFQRKWQANRLAAAEIEELSYRFLRDPASDPRKHLLELGRIQLHRQLEIVGSKGGEKPEAAGKDDAKAKPAGANPQ